MFIAFEGPDNTGKSTSAAALDSAGQPDYNATKALHAQNVADRQGQSLAEQLVPHTYDRIDWFSHMVYRLSLPNHEWNDERPRTVFAMPDTHLVIKIHRPDLAQYISDELYEDGKLAEVNPMYFYFADFLTGLNRARGYALFRTVSMVEVSNDPRDGSFSQRLVAFDSPVTEFGPGMDTRLLPRLADDDESLLAWLQHDEQNRL